MYERLATRDSEQKKLTSEIGAALNSKDNKKALELSDKIRDLQKKDVKDIEELVNRSIDKFGKVKTKHRGTVDLSIKSGLTTRSGKNTKSINTFFVEAISPTLERAYGSVFGDKEYIIKGSTDEERIANANNIKTLLFVTSGSALRAWVARDPIRFKDFKEMTVEDFNKKYPPKEMPPSEKKQFLDALKIEKDPKATKEEKDKARKEILKRWEQVEKHFDEGWND